MKWLLSETMKDKSKIYEVPVGTDKLHRQANKELMKGNWLSTTRDAHSGEV